jgi:glutamate decarboxylase
MRTRGTHTGRHHKLNGHFANEKHSLQGKSGKTHGVC